MFCLLGTAVAKQQQRVAGQGSLFLPSASMSSVCQAIPGTPHWYGGVETSLSKPIHRGRRRREELCRCEAQVSLVMAKFGYSAYVKVGSGTFLISGCGLVLR